MTTTLDNAARTTSNSTTDVRSKNDRALSVNPANAKRLLRQTGATISPLQILRELIHNGLHAVYLLAFAMVGTIAVERNGVPKLAVWDTGIGMSAAELPELIGELASSKVDDQGRHGMGTKIVCEVLSPAGLEFITWTGFEPPCALTMYDDGEHVRLTDVRIASVDELPDDVQKAGHGTLVVVHGMTPNEDTFHALHNRIIDSVGRKSDRTKLLKGAQQYFNDRYAAVPSGINFSAWTFRNSAADVLNEKDMEPRIEGNVGTIEALKMFATASGTYVGDGYEIFWAVRGNSDDTKRSLGHNDGATLQDFVAVALEDGEVKGLWENYEFYRKSKLGLFGLMHLRTKAAIVIRITDPKRLGITINQERSGLFVGEHHLDLADWGKDFRENMPAELAAIAEETARNSRIDIDMEEFMKEYGEYFTARGFHVSSRSSAASAGGGADVTGRSEVVAKNTQTKGAAKAALTSSPRMGDVQKVMYVPKVEEWRDAGPEAVQMFAMWDPIREVLMINHECVAIDREFKILLNSRKDAESITKAQRIAARPALINVMTLAAVESVMNTLARIKEEPGIWESQLDSPSITNAATCGIQRRAVGIKAIRTVLGPER